MNKEKVDEIFNSIKKASTKEELIALDPMDIYKIDTNKFPKLNLSISVEKLEALVAKDLLDSDFSFTFNQENKPDIMSKLTTPLEKFLFAMAWKNGDLPKLKHIIKGFSDASNSINETESAFVFYHFGRHLANPQEEPIIDQHILRAFMVYKYDENNFDLEEFTKILKFATIGKKQKELIKEYKEWLKSDQLCEVAKIEDYGYYIDRILFSLGKSIKIKK